MFDEPDSFDEWEGIPASELSSLGDWDMPNVPGEPYPIPAGFDDLIHEAQLAPLGATTLALIAGSPIEWLSPEGCSLALQTLTQLGHHIEALRAEFTAAIAGPKPTQPGPRPDDFAAHEVAVATVSSVYAADRQVWLARDLMGRLSKSADAMRRGEMSWAQAKALSEATTQLSDDVAQAIEAKMLIFAHRQDLTLFRAALRRWQAKLDPDYVPKSEEARREVEVTHTAHDDGTGQLYIRGPLEITAMIKTALAAFAAKSKSDLGGTAEQRMLSCLRDWAEAYLANPDAPTQHGRVPTVNVVIDLPTLLKLRENPAEILGYGAVPPDVARWLLADGAPLRRLITDPMTGHLLDYGRATYTAPADLADYLIAKHVRSAAPHSNVDARTTDMEHNETFDGGGHTDPINVTPCDRRWHRAKTHGGWKYESQPDGSILWTSPTGLTCQVDPYDYRAGP